MIARRAALVSTDAASTESFDGILDQDKIESIKMRGVKLTAALEQAAHKIDESES